jgi:hypothetical protein
MINFKVQELVGQQTYEQYGDKSLLMLDIPLIKDIDQLTTDLKAAGLCQGVMINNWSYAKPGQRVYTESGLRLLTTTTGVAQSMHKQGKAFDLKFSGGDLMACYEYLIANQFKYHNIRRCEDPKVTKTWLHLDSKHTAAVRIYVFKP